MIGSPSFLMTPRTAEWQFLNSESGPRNEAEAKVISLSELDASVVELADLPLGWHAWRDSRASPWKGARTA